VIQSLSSRIEVIAVADLRKEWIALVQINFAPCRDQKDFLFFLVAIHSDFTHSLCKIKFNKYSRSHHRDCKLR